MENTDELYERAIRMYAEVLAFAEPLRLHLWDSKGLTMTQLRLMFSLFKEDGITVSELARRSGFSPSVMTGILDRLGKARLIRRRADSRDRRVTRVYLAPEGKSFSAEVDAIGRSLVGNVVRRLGRDKVETLIETLGEFLEAARQVQAAQAVA